MQTKLDAKDRKLLFALDFHARDANAKLARKVRLSKQGVDYKISNLLRKGVIQGFAPIINGNQLGYFYGRLLFKLQNLTKEKEQKIIAEIAAEKRVKWVMKAEGRYDLAMATWAKTLEEFKGLSESLTGRYGSYIREKRESIGIRLAHFQSRYVTGARETEQVVFEETAKPAEIDAMDRKILKLVTNNARMPLVEIAAASGTSAKVAAYRLKRLQEKKVILGYRPVINNELIGFTFYKAFFYLKNVSEEKLRQLKAHLRSLPEVMYIVEEIGITDIDIELMLPSGESIFRFIDSKVSFEFPQLVREYEAFRIRMVKLELLPF